MKHDVPTFCRHNRLIENCSICTREQKLQMRPLVTGGSASAPLRESRSKAASGTSPKPARARSADRPARTGSRALAGAARREPAGGLRVRRLARGTDDGFSSPLLPGLKSSEDAARLVDEVAFAAARLTLMQAVANDAERMPAGAAPADQPPSDGTRTEEPRGGATPAVWTQIADPSRDGDERIRLALHAALAGERGVDDTAAVATIDEAFDAWVGRAGSAPLALAGESFWTPERRFERTFERLAFKGFTRDARMELLIMLGRLGVGEFRPATLHLTGENEATWAAKRAMGIAEPVLLERRVKEFAEATSAPLDALDLALHNWGSGHRLGVGIDPDTAGDGQVREAGLGVLGL